MSSRLALWGVLLIAGALVVSMLALCHAADLMLGSERRVPA